MATSDLTKQVFREALVFAKSVEQYARNELNNWIETENTGIEQQRMELLEEERNLQTKTEAFEADSTAFLQEVNNVAAVSKSLKEKEKRLTAWKAKLQKEKQDMSKKRRQMVKEANEFAKAKECFNRFLMEKQTEFDRKTDEFQEKHAQKEIELNRKATDVQEMLDGLRAKEEQINAKEQELAVKERMIALEKEDLVKEKKKIASDQEGLAIERKQIADKTREERRLLDETQAKLKKRSAELKERRSYLDGREQNLAVLKITELDLKCKLAKLEEEKEKFEKWKGEEESTLLKQHEQLTLQGNMTAKPDPMEELASRGWMRIGDFFDDLYHLKLTSNLNVSESTLSCLSKLLERLQYKRKIVDGMIKIDQNATCITLGKPAEDGSPTPLISESSPDGFDSTLRTLYNTLLSKVTKPTQGCNSVASISSFN